MRQVREVLRLKWACGLSDRKIAQSLRVSRPTVAEYVRRAQAAGLSWPLPATLDDTALERQLCPTAANTPAARRPTPDWAMVHREWKRKDVTLVLLWQAYKAITPDGLQYSQFCAAYRTWAGKLDLVMRQSHRAGETLFVDYAGQTMPVVNPLTGEVHAAAIFIAVLGASNSPFAEATWSQSLPAWIGSHVRAFAALGGVPQILVPENLKAAVSRGHRYEPERNRTYADLAQHSGVAVVPARARRPRDKAKVEVGVQGVERGILTRLRHHTFFSLLELSTAMTALLGARNRRPFKTLSGSRQSVFESLDCPALRPLPAQPYAYAEWKLVRVNIDYHVEVAGHSYSVPYSLVKQQLEVRLSAQVVAIFHKGKRVASHQRSPLKGRHSTVVAPMPTAHRRYAEWTPQRLMLWAAKPGEATAPVVATILASRPHPQQGFRARLGIMRMTARSDRRLTTRLRQAKLRLRASLEDIDYRPPRGLDTSLMLRLASCQWVHDRHHVRMTGPTGIGTTWLACALGHTACRAGYTVLYLRLPRLLQALPMAKGDGRYPKLMASLANTAFLILDDWGLATLSDENRRDVFELLEDRHGRCATMVTSPFPVDRWYEAIGAPTLADAILDRLLHNAYKITLRGDSMRKRHATVTNDVPST